VETLGGSAMLRAALGVLGTWALFFLTALTLSDVDPESGFRERPSLAHMVVLSGMLASTTFALWLVLSGAW